MAPNKNIRGEFYGAEFMSAGNHIFLPDAMERFKGRASHMVCVMKE